MPNSVTIARAMSVARSRSFCAPVEISPNTISSAVRPPSSTASWFSSSVLRASGSDPRAAAASCSRARRSRAPTIETLCTGSRPGRTRADDRVAGLVDGDDAPHRAGSSRASSRGPRRRDRWPRRSPTRSTAVLSRRAASSAASLTRLARSAPANPAVRAAMTLEVHRLGQLHLPGRESAGSLRGP